MKGLIYFVLIVMALALYPEGSTTVAKMLWGLIVGIFGVVSVKAMALLS